MDIITLNSDQNFRGQIVVDLSEVLLLPGKIFMATVALLLGCWAVLFLHLPEEFSFHWQDHATRGSNRKVSKIASEKLRFLIKKKHTPRQQIWPVGLVYATTCSPDSVTNPLIKYQDVSKCLSEWRGHEENQPKQCIFQKKSFKPDSNIVASL